MTAAKKKYLAVYEVGSNNLSGFLPDVPGIVSTAPNPDAMRQAMRGAVAFHFAAGSAHGDSIPGPRTTSVDFPGGRRLGILSCIVEWLEIEVRRMQNVA